MTSLEVRHVPTRTGLIDLPPPDLLAAAECSELPQVPQLPNSPSATFPIQRIEPEGSRRAAGEPSKMASLE
eukprot:4067966-Prymnesium_polylepis.1